MSVGIADLVDVERYPIDRPDHPATSQLLSRARAALADVGAFELPGFLRPAAVAAAVDEAATIRPLAFRTDHVHDLEFSGASPDDLPAGDPRRVGVRSAKWGTAYDDIPASSPLRAVYESDVVARFVGRALGVDPLHRLADPLGALNVMFYDPGDELGWHVDNAEFAVTLMLQGPESGGAFEYSPMLRSEHDRNDAGVLSLLTGDRTGVRALSGGPGTLTLFRGHWSPHRVTPVAGSRPRINAVLSYSRRPDHHLSAETYRLFYGRTPADA